MILYEEPTRVADPRSVVEAALLLELPGDPGAQAPLVQCLVPTQQIAGGCEKTTGPVGILEGMSHLKPVPAVRRRRTARFLTILRKSSRHCVELIPKGAKIFCFE
jgi:hypothetical protein